MAQISIFDKAIVDEPCYTRLLYNLMSRSHSFQQQVLRVLLPKGTAVRIKSHDIQPEASLGEYGRPDLTIRARNIYALVEIKVKPECALTENQSLDGEISGYLDFLSMRTEQKRMLVYLVPRHWFYLGSLTKSRD